MGRRKLSEKDVRKIMKNGNFHVVSIPVSDMRALKWKEKQKVVVKRRGKSIIITDWVKK